MTSAPFRTRTRGFAAFAAAAPFALVAPHTLADDCNSNTIDDDAELASIELPDRPARLSASVAGFPTGSFTIEMWVRQSGPEFGPDAGIFSYNTAGQDDAILLKDFHNFGVVINGIEYASGLDLGPDDQWVHLAVAFKGTTGDLGIHVNGVNVGYQAGFLPSTSINPVGCLYLGDDHLSECGGIDISRFFVGNYRQVRIWNSYRTAAQVATNYKQSLTGSESGLLAYWPMDEGTGAIAANLVSADDLTLNNSATWDDADANDNGILDSCETVHNITQGSGFLTIQDAIDTSVNGDVLEVDPGTYVERINFLGKSITVRSASGDPADTIIDGSAGGEVVRCVTSEGFSTVLEGFTITNGLAADGGGIYCLNSSPQIIRCRIMDNVATDDGGGLYAEGGAPFLVDCAFLGNSAPTAGGAFNRITASTYVNCTFTGNAASDFGGGMYTTGGAVSVTNCTFTGNTAAISGSGMRNVSAALAVSNCIFWGNTSTQLTNNGGTPTVAYCNIEGGLTAGCIDGGGNINADPIFADADGADDTYGTADDDLRLMAASPCIDAADSGAPDLVGIVQDLSGAPRLVNTRVPNTGAGPAPIVDMGAFESQGVVYNNTTQVAYDTIQGALDAALSGHIVFVDPGTYVENIDYLGKSVYLYGSPTNPANTVIDGSGSGSVVRFASGETTGAILLGFTITNGSSVDGGGIYCLNSSPTIYQCVIADNASSDDGGGLYTENGAPRVWRCRFLGNSSATAGGAFNRNASTQYENCAFSGNTATDFGGGMYTTGGAVVVTNCAFTGNTAAASGSGMRNTGATLTVANSVFWGNTSTQLTNNGSAATVSYCNIQGGLTAGCIDGGGNIDADPKFVDADGADDTFGTVDDDMSLAPRSRCIDAGDNNTPHALSTDLASNPRYHDDPGRIDTGAGTAPIVDIGPYEF